MPSVIRFENAQRHDPVEKYVTKSDIATLVEFGFSRSLLTASRTAADLEMAYEDATERGLHDGCLFFEAMLSARGAKLVR
jgi:hypothetical protein